MVALSVVAMFLALRVITIVHMASAMRVFQMNATNVVHTTTHTIVQLMDLSQMITGVHNVVGTHTVPLVNLGFITILKISVANYVARGTTRLLVPGTDLT